MKHTYITRAILKDYLTIKNVDITFNSGINIIIGKNGTGKTNFINYLADSLEVSPYMTNNFSEIYFNHEEEKYRKNVIKTLTSSIGKDISFDEMLQVKLYKNDILIEDNSLSFVITSTKISHGLPMPYFIADEAINDTVKKDERYLSIFPNTKKNRLVQTIGQNYAKDVFLTDVPRKFYNIDGSIKLLKEYLGYYSNIQDIRIGKNFVLEDVNDKETRFNNLYLEYLLNDEWLLFNQLSDGTKRLFYIISEVLLSNRVIILLEEPELGLHPHQLYDLMRFIKEMSDEFQFIITTHSPMVLNTLNSDELENIIISRIENGGTIMEHLTAEQIEKAKRYMEKLDLSDYWIHSDLED